MKESFIVDNLKCGGCANTIETKLSKMKGVEKVTVDPDNSSVVVEHSGECEREAFLQTLSDMGYPEEGTSNLLQKGKSYVSCVIGRVN